MGWTALVVAAGCLVTTALLGPSAAQAPLGFRDVGTAPPWHVAAAPPAWLVTLLPAIAVVAGVVVVTLLICGRWRPAPAPLAVAGIGVAAALALLPPLASADPLSYAAYGRMVVTGHDPYTTTPAQLAGTDRVAAAVEAPWQHEPSVYGPLATAEQAVAAEAGGPDPARVVLVLDLIGLVAFVATGAMLMAAADDETGRRRAAALWLANPLIWLQVVAGAHVDVFVAFAAAAAVVVARRGATGTWRSEAAGAGLAGVAAIVKPTGGLVWLAIAWQSRRSWRRLAFDVAALVVVVVTAYAGVGTGALHQLARAGRRVSHATPWRAVLETTHTPRGLIGAMAILLAAALAVVIARNGRPTTVPVVAVAVTIGYVLAAPYALPWYDALPWALLPLVAASWRDWVLLAHTSALSVAYLPGRDAVRLHGLLQSLTHAMRSVVAPLVVVCLLLAVAVRARARRTVS